MSDLTPDALSILRSQHGHVSTAQLAAAGVGRRARIAARRVDDCSCRSTSRSCGSSSAPRTLEASLRRTVSCSSDGLHHGPTRGSSSSALRRMQRPEPIHFSVPHGDPPRSDRPMSFCARQPRSRPRTLDAVATGSTLASPARLAFDLAARSQPRRPRLGRRATDSRSSLHDGRTRLPSPDACAIPVVAAPSDSPGVSSSEAIAPRRNRIRRSFSADAHARPRCSGRRRSSRPRLPNGPRSESTLPFRRRGGPSRSTCIPTTSSSRERPTTSDAIGNAISSVGRSSESPRSTSSISPVWSTSWSRSTRPRSAAAAPTSIGVSSAAARVGGNTRFGVRRAGNTRSGVGRGRVGGGGGGASGRG